MCRIRYWQQETLESGKWVLTNEIPLETVPLETVKRILSFFERGEIIPNEVYNKKEKVK